MHSCLVFASRFAGVKPAPLYNATPGLCPSCLPITCGTHQDNALLLVSLGGFSVRCPGPPIRRPLKRWNSWSSKSSSDKMGTPIWLFWKVRSGTAADRGIYVGPDASSKVPGVGPFMGPHIQYLPSGLIIKQ